MSGTLDPVTSTVVEIPDEPSAVRPRLAPVSHRFMPALEGMRGLAALGVVVTHVAFQTGATSWPLVGRVLERFDMAVAVFFALSGFLLWRPHVAQARGFGAAPGWGSYLRARAARILPAYWLVVCVVLLLLPSAAHAASARVWWANLSLVQVFVPLTLTDGLTQMWSLSVEVAFYLVLPVIAWVLSRVRGRGRIGVVVALGVVSLGWNLIPIPTPEGIHSDNWLPGYLPWFVAGMVLAELAAAPGLVVRWRWLGKRRVMWGIALAGFVVSATNLGGVAGLTRAQPWQYAAKMGFGAVIGFCLLAPVALVPDGAYRWLRSAPAAALGRWSYGVFIWHLAVLTIVFPIFGLVPFHGDFGAVLLLTVGFTVPVAAVSHALVEQPVRRWVRRWDQRPAPASSATPQY